MVSVFDCRCNISPTPNIVKWRCLLSAGCVCVTAGVATTALSTDAFTKGAHVCVCVYVCVCACECVRACACFSACVRARASGCLLACMPVCLACVCAWVRARVRRHVCARLCLTFGCVCVRKLILSIFNGFFHHTLAVATRKDTYSSSTRAEHTNEP